MSTITDKREALRLLSGLENGTMNTADAFVLAETLDPVLVYLIVRYLRESYPASDPAATSVLERVVALTSGHAAFVPLPHPPGEEKGGGDQLEAGHRQKEGPVPMYLPSQERPP